MIFQIEFFSKLRSGFYYGMIEAVIFKISADINHGVGEAIAMLWATANHDPAAMVPP